jgi:hypothetical protein
VSQVVVTVGSEATTPPHDLLWSRRESEKPYIYFTDQTDQTDQYKEKAFIFAAFSLVSFRLPMKSKLTKLTKFGRNAIVF